MFLALQTIRSGTGMATTAEQLLGTWQKATGDACAERYPPTIELRPQSIYEAPEGPQLGSLWHGGSWTVEAGAVLIVQAANDADLRYRIADVDGSAFTFIDDRDCRVTYRRQ
jgi:hypothetical protein